MLAVLFGALAPALSHAVTTSAVQEYVEVCTSHGVQVLPLDAGAGGSGDDALARHAGHCGHCITHANPVAMTPPVPFVFATLGGHDAYPPLYYRSPRPLATWIAANPRGPPFVRA